MNSTWKCSDSETLDDVERVKGNRFCRLRYSYGIQLNFNRLTDYSVYFDRQLRAQNDRVSFTATGKKKPILIII